MKKTMACVLLAGLAVSASAQNLLKNPDFNEIDPNAGGMAGYPASWQVFGTANRARWRSHDEGKWCIGVCGQWADIGNDASLMQGGIPVEEGKTYQLTDPNPPSAREVAQIFADLMHKKAIFLPAVKPSLLRTLLVTVPGMEQLTGLPGELLDYFGFTTTYATTNTTTDLEGTGLTCPAFADYAGTLLEFMHAHPEIDSKPMV